MLRTCLGLAVLLVGCASETGDESSDGGNVVIDATGQWQVTIERGNGEADVNRLELVQSGTVVDGRFCSSGWICDGDEVTGTISGADLQLSWSKAKLSATISSDALSLEGELTSTDPMCSLCMTQVSAVRVSATAGGK